MKEPQSIPTETATTSTESTTARGDNSDNTNEDLATPNREPTPIADSPIRLIRAALEDDTGGFRPTNPPQRTMSSQQKRSVSPSEKKKSSRPKKDSGTTSLVAPKQHLAKALTPKPKKHGKKTLKLEKAAPSETYKDSDSIDTNDSFLSTGDSEKKKKKKKKKKVPKEKSSAHKSVATVHSEKGTSHTEKKKNVPKEKASAQRSISNDPSAKSKSHAEANKKMPLTKPDAKNAIRTDPSPQNSTRTERSIEKTRVTTRAASSSVMSSASRSRKGGNERTTENENHSHDDEDHSVSTAPTPPSLRVQDHHSLRPGAYRMYTGGVARYVDSAGDDIDDDYSTNDYSNTTYDNSRVDNTIDAVATLEASLVEDEPLPPLYRPTTSQGFPMAAHTRPEYGEHMGTDISTLGLASTTPTAITTVAIEEEDSSIGKDDEAKLYNKRNMRMIVSFVVVLIIVIASIVASNAVKRMRKRKTEPLTPMEVLIDALPDYTKESLKNEDSDQSKGLDWMSTHDDIDSFPLERQLQRFALITLYYAISSQDPSQDILQVLASRDECTWYDAKCDDNIYTELSLRSVNRLVGTIIPELALLTSLESLLVDNNSFVGMIPPQLGEITTLKELRMNNNLFRGKIPTEFGQLSNLKDIDLSTNLLSGNIPSEIGKLNKVQTFVLANNTLSGTIPAEIGLMSELVTFSLASNQLEGQIPSTIIYWEKIESFNVERNFLSGRSFPDIDLGAAAGGQLGKPLGTLKYLSLAVNDFTGTMPAGLGALTSLLELDLSRNKFRSDFPTEIGNLRKLTNLQLFGNRFDDSIPTELGFLSNIERMSLHHNLFTGTVPFEICDLPFLPKEDITVDCERVFCMCCTCGPKRKNPPPGGGGPGGGGGGNGPGGGGGNGPGGGGGNGNNGGGANGK